MSYRGVYFFSVANSFYGLQQYFAHSKYNKYMLNK